MKKKQKKTKNLESVFIQNMVKEKQNNIMKKQRKVARTSKNLLQKSF